MLRQYERPISRTGQQQALTGDFLDQGSPDHMLQPSSRHLVRGKARGCQKNGVEMS